uniref:Uncharacterized protein n=1 Tax=viral metagenome TaxID=1070528 RepID=A0A6M3L361_9ZZZZ
MIRTGPTTDDCSAGELKRFIARLAAGLGVLLVGQIVTCIWWAATINTRVNYLERTQVKIVDRLDGLQHRPVAEKP